MLARKVCVWGQTGGWKRLGRTGGRVFADFGGVWSMFPFLATFGPGTFKPPSPTSLSLSLDSF